MNITDTAHPTINTLYTHNHQTYENHPDYGYDAPSWHQMNEKKTVGYYMSMAGYKTGLFGKWILLNYYYMK